MGTRANTARVERLRRRARVDACVGVGAFLLAGGAAVRFDVASTVGSVAGLPLVGLILASVTLTVFAVRRWLDVSEVDAYFARHRTERDELTGLPNRVVVNDQLVRAIRRARRTGETIAVFFLDLDRFKGINDTYGHETGDAVLKAVADRLREALRERDLLARYGGDEFVVVCTGVQNEAHAETIAQRISDGFREPFAVAGQRFSLTVSIGIAFSIAGKDNDPVAVLRDADTAMYSAKAQGRGCSVAFAASMSNERAERNATAQRISRGLEKDEFHLVYQPVVDLVTERIVGVEALLRWTDPERGVVSPAEFIPMLEQTGLIVDVGAWVLQEALTQVVVWRSRYGDRAPTVSVNVTALQLTQPDFSDTVIAALKRAGADPRQLCLEVTEAGLMADVASSWAGLRQLKMVGVRLALDDFGTGYSSLSYVRSFSLDYVKIDKSFVDGVTDCREDAAIIQAIVQLTRALGIQGVAEGIETREQLAALRATDCHLGQGYLFSRPQPADVIEHMLQGVPQPTEPGLTRVF